MERVPGFNPTSPNVDQEMDVDTPEQQEVSSAMDQAVQDINKEAEALGFDLHGGKTKEKRFDDDLSYLITFGEVPGVDRYGSPTVGALVTIDKSSGKPEAKKHYGLYPRVGDTEGKLSTDSLEEAIALYKSKYGK
jgi:hypothetical protein